MVILVIAAAMVGKLGGCSVAARLSGLNWRDSITTGVFMNAKGLVELIVLNVGLDLGVLTPLVFAIFVFMALFTTFITVPLIMLVNPPSRIIEEDKKMTRGLEAAAAAAAAAVAVAKSASHEAGSTDGGEETVIPASATGVQSAFLAAFGPHFAPSLVSVAAALLQRPRGKAGGRPGQAELCHLLPVTERPSSYLHTMTGSAVTRVPASGLFTAGPFAAASSASSAFHAALHSVSAAAVSVSESPDAAAGLGSLDIVVPASSVAADPAAVAEVEEDVTLLLGIERARHVQILDRLLLSQTYASDVASAISTAAGASDIILLGLDISSTSYGAAAPRRSISYGSGGSGAGAGAGDASESGMGGLLGALVNRLVPAHRTEDTIRSLKALAPSARLGVVVAPPASAFFGSAQVLRALLIIDDVAGEQDLLTTVGAALVANGVSLQVLLLTDMLTAGLEMGSRTTNTASLIGAAGAVAVAVGVASPVDSVTVQRTADEAARLLTAKLAVARALAGPHATDKAVAALSTASVHVAHRSALELALRVLTADCVALHGTAFDLVVVSGGAATSAAEPTDTLVAAGFAAAGAAAAAAASASAGEVELVAVKEIPIDAASVVSDAPTTSDERAEALPAPDTVAAASTATLAGTPAPASAPAQLPTPARTFPEIAGARGAVLSRRQSARVRTGTRAHIFSREDAGAGASFLGACADRILGANLGCSVLVYLQPDAPAATA
jgi:hypothetical protein